MKNSDWPCSSIGRRFSRAHIVAALLTVLLAGAASPAFAQVVGTITRLDGSAQIDRGGATVPAAMNMGVQLHDKITTSDNGWLTITMVDNSSLSLGGASTLTIDESMMAGGVPAPSKVGLVTGRLHTLIAGAMKGTNPTFEVHTPNAVGAVRGTEWDTTYDENEHPQKKDCRQWTEIWVEEGTVSESCGKKDKQVSAGQHALCGCGFWLEDVGQGAGFGIPGWIAVGAIVAGGGIIGGAAAGGGFNSPGNDSPSK